jgi:hypothetical protein
MIWNHEKIFVLSIEDGSRKSYDVDMGSLAQSGIGVLDWSPDGTKVSFAGTHTKNETYLLRDVIPESKR